MAQVRVLKISSGSIQDHSESADDFQIRSLGLGTASTGDGLAISGGLTQSSGTVSITGASITIGNASSSVSVGGDLSVASGQKVNHGDATVSQTSSITTAVTINSASGVITTQTATAGSNGSNSFTVNNSTVLGSSVVVATLGDYSGTFGGNGQPIVDVDSIVGGSFSIRIRNVHNSNSLNGTLKIKFAVL